MYVHARLKRHSEGFQCNMKLDEALKLLHSVEIWGEGFYLYATVKGIVMPAGIQRWWLRFSEEFRPRISHCGLLWFKVAENG